jgi:hypothetical protein
LASVISKESIFLLALDVVDVPPKFKNADFIDAYLKL